MKQLGSADMAIRFHGELAGLASGPDNDGTVGYRLDRRASIKDVVESLGVPHTEVYSIELDGEVVDFTAVVEPGGVRRADVRPASIPVDVTRPTLLRPDPLPELRFVVDENVARLAALLRTVGLDAAYDRASTDAEIAARARDEDRVALSRDRMLLKRSNVGWGRLVRGVKPMDQLVEVLGFFACPPLAFFSRCIRCNVLLESVGKVEVDHLLEPRTRKYYHDFSRCPGCGRIFWAGSHYEHMRARLSGAGLLD